MNIQRLISFISRNRRLVAASAVLVLIVLAFSKISIVEISIKQTAQGPVNHSFLNQRSNKTLSLDTKKQKKTKLLFASTYEVTSTSGSKTSYSVVKASGFFRKTKVNVDLKEESFRSFVANNPSSCSFYKQDILYSHSCGGQMDKIFTHVPSTKSTPTFAAENTNGLPLEIQDTVSTNSKTFILGKSPVPLDGSGATHVLYELADNLNIAKAYPLAGLDDSKTYSVKPFKEGYAVYSNDFTDIKYYKSLSDTPETINIEKPKNTELTAQYIDINQETVLVLYGDAHDSEANDATDKSGELVEEKQRVIELALWKDGSSSLHNFTDKGQAFKLCGGDRICALKEKDLSVYKLKKNKATLAFTISSVDDVYTVGSETILKRFGDMIHLNIDSGMGSIGYRFGDYRNCGVTTDNTGYTLCVINKKNEKSAIRINTGKANEDSIDQKIYGLLSLIYITTLNINGNNISISPNLGSPKYDTATDSFGYDAATKKAAKEAIDQAIDQARIDRTKFNISIIGVN